MAAKRKTERRGPRRRRPPEEARALIIEAAQRLFADVGPDAAGLKEVAAEAGVSHGLVSHYFGTYEQLVDAAFLDWIEKLREKLLGHFAGGGDRTIEGVIDAFFDAVGDPLYGRLVGWVFLTGRLGSRDSSPRGRRVPKLIVDAIEAHLTDGRRSSPDREQLEALLAVIWAAAIGYAAARPFLWESLGRKPSARRDAQFRGAIKDIAQALIAAGS